MSVFEIVTKVEDLCPTIERFEKRLRSIRQSSQVKYKEGHAYTN